MVPGVEDHDFANPVTAERVFQVALLFGDVFSSILYLYLRTLQREPLPRYRHYELLFSTSR